MLCWNLNYCRTDYFCGHLNFMNFAIMKNIEIRYLRLKYHQTKVNCNILALSLQKIDDSKYETLAICKINVLAKKYLQYLNEL